MILHMLQIQIQRIFFPSCDTLHIFVGFFGLFLCFIPFWNFRVTRLCPKTQLCHASLVCMHVCVSLPEEASLQQIPSSITHRIPLVGRATRRSPVQPPDQGKVNTEIRPGCSAFHSIGVWTKSARTLPFSLVERLQLGVACGNVN